VASTRLGRDTELVAAEAPSGYETEGPGVCPHRTAQFGGQPERRVVVMAAPGSLDESRPSGRPRVDVPGAVTVTGALLAIRAAGPDRRARPEP
jgi:hypothetical protein